MYIFLPRSHFKSKISKVCWTSRREDNIKNRASRDFSLHISSSALNELSTRLALVSDYQPNVFIVCKVLLVMCSDIIWQVLFFCSILMSHFPISIGLTDDNEDDTTGDGSSDDSSDSSSSDTWS